MDIFKICRICLQNTNLLVNLFDDLGSIMLSSKIINLTNVEIHPDDGLPVSICVNCNQKLDQCIEFIKLCKESDYKLRNNTKEENNRSHIDSTNDCKLIPKMQNLCFEKELKEEIQSPYKISIEECCTVYDQKRQSQKQQCFTCGKIMSSRFRLKTHLATHLKDKQHTCTYCKKQFTIVENLNAHIRIHTGEKPYRCATCGETFAQSSGLIVHKRKHTGQTPYKCVLCPRSFQTIGNFKYHVRVHTGERKYNCSTCGRAFITNGDLKQHIATHSGVKPHVCPVCGIKFSRASNLKRHVTYLHNDEKTFSCEYCHSKFDRKIELVKHKKCHKNK